MRHVGGLVPGLPPVALAAVLLAACYNPQIADGALRCSVGPNECPDGFKCSGGVCIHNASGGGGTGGRGGGGGGAGGAGGNSQMCPDPYGPYPMCAVTRPPGGCDPVCQAGCN